jgi:hypothetical protein
MSEAVDLFGQPDERTTALRQLPLPLAWRGRGGDQPLLIGDANREAVAAIAGFTAWPTPLAVLTGPRQSGKSMLGAYLRHVCSLASVVDPVNDADEEAIFHACNRALKDTQPLLLIIDADEEPWQPTLPDLATRIGAAQHLVIGDPDPALFAAMLTQRLSRAGIPLGTDTARFIADRAERSYVALGRIAGLLAAAVTERGARLTTASVRQILIDNGQLFSADIDSAAA